MTQPFTPSGTDPQTGKPWAANPSGSTGSWGYNPANDQPWNPWASFGTGLSNAVQGTLKPLATPGGTWTGGSDPWGNAILGITGAIAGAGALGVFGGAGAAGADAAAAAAPSYLDTAALPASAFSADAALGAGAAGAADLTAPLLAGDFVASDVGGVTGLGTLGANFLAPSAATTALDPAIAQQLGIDFSLASAPSAGGLGFDTSLLSAPAAAGGDTIPTIIDTSAAAAGAGGGGGGAGGYFSQLGNFLTNPKNLPSLGLGGLSLFNALKTPKLPSQLNPVMAANTTASNAANATIAGGGTASPNWAQQKASIDASINQQLQQQSEALQQNAANTGQQGMVVQQQLNQLKQTLETQRQTLYQQAQAANVNQAISELTGSNQALTGIANLQLQQDQAAQQASNQMAELALLLASKG